MRGLPLPGRLHQNLVLVAEVDAALTADDVRLVVTCSGGSEWTCAAPFAGCVATISSVANRQQNKYNAIVDYISPALCTPVTPSRR